MIGLTTITTLIAKYGLAIVAPIAVVEGPIVTVIAAWLASQGILGLWSVSLIVIAADIVGDFILYAMGRWGLNRLPAGLMARLGLTRARLEGLGSHFAERGGRSLLIGKVTHSMGFAVLAAAGMARMPAVPFFWYNLLGTIPKSLLFVALGYGFGSAYATIDSWLSRFSLFMGAAIIGLAAVYLLRRFARS